MAKAVKKQRTTIEKYKYWRNWNVGLTATKFAMPMIPFGVVLGLNWSDWVGNSPSEGWSIGIGFGMLIVATISGIVAVWKKDELIESKVSAVFYIAIIMAVIGFGFKMLASMINEMGNMFLYISMGIVGSGVLDQVNKSAIAPRVKFYKNLVETNGLSKTAARDLDDTEQAKKEGEQAKAERNKQKNYL